MQRNVTRQGRTPNGRDSKAGPVHDGPVRRARRSEAETGAVGGAKIVKILKEISKSVYLEIGISIKWNGKRCIITRNLLVDKYGYT